MHHFLRAADQDGVVLDILIQGHRNTTADKRFFKCPVGAGTAIPFVTSISHGRFHPRRHLMSAAPYRCARDDAFRIWRQEQCVQLAA